MSMLFFVTEPLCDSLGVSTMTVAKIGKSRLKKKRKNIFFFYSIQCIQYSRIMHILVAYLHVEMI
jgi:hypothetical protein